MPITTAVQNPQSIPLPPPQTGQATTLMQALKHRRSTREFAPKPLPRDTLSTLLWAAFGINRPDSGGRTAPSAHNWQEIFVYAALADGLFRYDATGHSLQPVTAADLRALTGMQDFVSGAPLNLVYVADFSRTGETGAEEREFLAAADAGFIAQNVYLFCAATGLATVVRGFVDRKKLAAALGLGMHERIILAQTVGFPAS
ncbi:MAG: SagB/ThcOx family dehydrogenase [Betaproteobacteria bacterium]